MPAPVKPPVKARADTGLILEEMIGSMAPGKSSGMNSLQEIALIAIKHNPNVDITRWQVESARASLDLVKVGYHPKVEYLASRGPESVHDNGTNASEWHYRSEATLKASQLLYDFGRTKADVGWARKLKQSSTLRMAHKIETTLFDVADIYLKVIEQDRLIANSSANENAHKNTYRLVKMNEQGGNATTADVQKAYTRLENARTQKIELISQRQRSASEFELITGVRPGHLKTPNFRRFSSGALSERKMSSYVARHPFLKSIKVDTRSLRYQQEALTHAYRPVLSLEGNASIKENVAAATSVQKEARLLVVLRGDLYDGGDKAAKLHQLAARIGENEARYRKATYDLERDVQDTIRILRTARSKRKSIQQRIAASGDVVKLYTQQFKIGKRGIFELLDAQKELFAARAEQITNRFDVLRAHYASQLYTGGLITGLLGGRFSTKLRLAQKY